MEEPPVRPAVQAGEALLIERPPPLVQEVPCGSPPPLADLVRVPGIGGRRRERRPDRHRPGVFGGRTVQDAPEPAVGRALEEHARRAVAHRQQHPEVVGGRQLREILGHHDQHALAARANQQGTLRHPEHPAAAAGLEVEARGAQAATLRQQGCLAVARVWVRRAHKDQRVEPGQRVGAACHEARQGRTRQIECVEAPGPGGLSRHVGQVAVLHAQLRQEALCYGRRQIPRTVRPAGRAQQRRRVHPGHEVEIAGLDVHDPDARYLKLHRFR